MSKSTDLNAKIRFVFEVDATGGIAQLSQAEDGVKTLTFQIGEITQVTNNIREATSSYGTSIRGLLLNLRMFSFAVRTLRREFGDTNPVIENISASLITVAAFTTGVAAAWDITTKATKAFMASSAPLIGTLKIIIGVFGAWQTALVALALIALPGVVKGLFELTSGVSKFRREAKELETDINMLEAGLDRLSLTQDRFNLGLSMTALSIMQLKRAIDLQQSGTAAMEAQLEAYNAELVNQRINQAGLNLQAQEQNLILKETQALQLDLKRQQEAARIAGRIAGGAGMALTQQRVADALRQMGWEPGQPINRRRLMGIVREQTAGGITPRGGAGGATVTVNFPNAFFQTAEGVREAIIEGATEAGRIIFNQYAEPGAQR